MRLPQQWQGWMSAAAGGLAGALLVAAIPAGSFFVPAEPPAAGEVTGERWACPMMDFIGRKPGDCPVCGMRMERVTAGELNREQQRRMGVRTSTVSAGPAAVVVRAYGSAEYDGRFSQAVIARVPGRIVRRHPAAIGEQREVAAGDPLLDLYSPEAFRSQSELAAALAAGDAALAAAIEERFARWNLADVARAIRSGAAPCDVVTVRSPAAGRVWLADQASVDRTLMIGGEVTADMPLLTLVDPRRLTLVLHVPEPRARFLRAGQRVQLASDDMGELPQVAAVVGRVADELDPQIRAREVRIHLDDAQGLILPGSLIAARIQAVLGRDLQPADPADPASWGVFPLVAKSAVLSTGVRHVVWRVRSRGADGAVRFEPATVALGPRLESPTGEDRYVVRAGLAAGDEVATQGAFLIDSQAQLAGSASLLFPDGAVGVDAGHQH